MSQTVDYAFAVLFAVVVSLFEYFVFWPRFRDAIRSGAPDARVRGYRRVVIGQWTFAIAALAIWRAYDRPLGALGLSTPTGWRLVVGVGIIVAIVYLAAAQIRSVSRTTAERRVALRPRLGTLAFMLPHTTDERGWFIALSVTAGVCEELLYRGYLVWVLQPWLGLIGAALASVVLFGLGHGYQGRNGLVRATLAGAVMATVVLVTHWLVPAMVVHAVIDASAGMVGYALLSGERGAGTGVRVAGSG